MTFSQRKWPGVTFFKAYVHCPWSKLAFCQKLILTNLRPLTEWLFSPPKHSIFYMVFFERQITRMAGNPHLDRHHMPYEMCQGHCHNRYGIGRRGIRTGDKQVSHGKNSLEQKVCLTFTLLWNTLVDGWWQYTIWKIRRKIGKTSGENVDPFCGGSGRLPWDRQRKGCLGSIRKRSQSRSADMHNTTCARLEGPHFLIAEIWPNRQVMENSQKIEYPSSRDGCSIFCELLHEGLAGSS